MSMQTQAAARKVNKHIEPIKRVSLYLPKSLGQRVEQSASQLAIEPKPANYLHSARLVYKAERNNRKRTEVEKPGQKKGDEN